MNIFKRVKELNDENIRMRGIQNGLVDRMRDMEGAFAKHVFLVKHPQPKIGDVIQGLKVTEVKYENGYTSLAANSPFPENNFPYSNNYQGSYWFIKLFDCKKNIPYTMVIY